MPVSCDRVTSQPANSFSSVPVDSYERYYTGPNRPLNERAVEEILRHQNRVSDPKEAHLQDVEQAPLKPLHVTYPSQSSPADALKIAFTEQRPSLDLDVRPKAEVEPSKKEITHRPPRDLGGAPKAVKVVPWQSTSICQVHLEETVLTAVEERRGSHVKYFLEHRAEAKVHIFVVHGFLSWIKYQCFKFFSQRWMEVSLKIPFQKTFSVLIDLKDLSWETKSERALIRVFTSQLQRRGGDFAYRLIQKSKD